MTSPEPHGTSQPDVVAAMRGDLADWRQWLARLIVLAAAAAAGLSVVAFSRLCDLASLGFKTVTDLHPLMPLAWTPAVHDGRGVADAALRAGCRRLGHPAGDGHARPGLPAGGALHPRLLAHERRQDGVDGRLAAGRARQRARGPVGADRRRRDAARAPLAAAASRHLRPRHARGRRRGAASPRHSTRRWPASCSPSRSSRRGWSSAAAA